MPKFIVDLWLDGYETEEEMEDACVEFIYEQLNMTASSVSIKEIPSSLNEKSIEEYLNRYKDLKFKIHDLFKKADAIPLSSRGAQFTSILNALHELSNLE
jgi:hypothetical protein